MTKPIPCENLSAYLLNLSDHQCRYISGDMRESSPGFCQAKRKNGSPYCLEHSALCHREDTKTYKQWIYRT